MLRSLLILSLLLTASATAVAQTETDLDRPTKDLIYGTLTNPDPDKAIDLAGRLLIKLPDYAPAFHRIGQLYELKAAAAAKLGQAEEAGRLMDEARINYSKAAEAALISSGRMMARNREFDKAIIEFTRAISLAPKATRKSEANKTTLVALAFYHRGLAYAEMDDYMNALSDWGAAVEWYPGYAEAYYNMGLAMNLRGESDSAINITKKALSWKKEYKDAAVSLGFFYQKKGDFTSAEKTYQESLKYNPNDPELIHLRGVALLGEPGREEDALQALQAAVRARPDDPSFLSDLGLAQFRSRQYPAAAESLKTAASIEQQDPVIFTRLGDAYREMKRPADALEAYKKAHALTDRNDSAALDELEKKMSEVRREIGHE